MYQKVRSIPCQSIKSLVFAQSQIYEQNKHQTLVIKASKQKAAHTSQIVKIFLELQHRSTQTAILSIFKYSTILKTHSKIAMTLLNSEEQFLYEKYTCRHSKLQFHSKTQSNSDEA